LVSSGNNAETVLPRWQLQELPHLVIPNLFRDLFFEDIYDDECVNSRKMGQT